MSHPLCSRGSETKLQNREIFFFSLVLFPFIVFNNTVHSESLQRGLQRNLISKEQKWVTVWTQAAHQRKMCQKIKNTADSSTGCDFQSSSERILHFHQDAITLNKSHTTCWCNIALFFSSITGRKQMLIHKPTLGWQNHQMTECFGLETILKIISFWALATAVPPFQRLLMVHHKRNINRTDCTGPSL